MRRWILRLNEEFDPWPASSIGYSWAFNGLAEMPGAPLFTARRGETVRLAMVCDTAWPHGMHLHGHHFRAIASDGTVGPLRDTLLMDRGEAVEVAFVADNPGTGCCTAMCRNIPPAG